MLIPAAVLMLVFHVVPWFGVAIAFMDYNPLQGFLGSQWVGMANFELLFLLPDFWDLLRNTMAIAVGKIVIGQVTAIVFALLLNEVYERWMWFKRLIQTLVYLPHFLSWVIIGGIMMDVLSSNGILNQGLRAAGMQQPPMWLGDPAIFPWTLILSDVWKGFGWGAIVFLAAIAGVGQEIYEAAAIDGAGRFRRMWHVTLPGIAPIVVLTWVLAIGGILNAGFDQILFLYNPAVYTTGDVLDTYVYRVGIQSAQWSFGQAVSLIKSSIGFVLVLLSWFLANKYSGWRPL
jgi:putative aldouronate transport system permease protein